MRMVFLIGVISGGIALSAHGAETSPRKAWSDPITGMTFEWVPKGCMTMGADQAHGDYPRIGHTPPHADEVPAHQVCVDDFWMGRYEVTQKEWRTVMGHNPAHDRDKDDHPVEMVTWQEAERFAQKLSERSPDQGRFRLPTEAEWEYACRSGGKPETHAGITASTEFQDVAWGNMNSDHHSHPVGSLKPNGLGLFDMSGNVYEWVEDGYQEDGYTRHTLHHPVNGAPNETRRVIRGGSFRSIQPLLLCSDRNWLPGDQPLPVLGFRLVKNAR